MDGPTDGPMDGPMGGPMDRLMDELTDGHTFLWRCMDASKNLFLTSSGVN